MSKHKNAKKILWFCLILILVLGLIYGGLQILESTVFNQGAEEAEVHSSKTINRDGVEYFPRQDITVVMVLGIDERGPVTSSGYYRNNGECDAVFLLILDQVEEKYSVLCLNRDSMVQMPALGMGSQKAGSFYGQLALSHTYGEGLEDSCENTRETIENLMQGLKIDHYISMNMDAIAIVNDAVGGVTVTVEDDFSKVDSSIPMGEVTLMGEQALSYVQTRMNVGTQLNLSRMGRHVEYMQGLVDAMNTKMESSDLFVVELYDKVSDYIVTDCSVNVISGLMERCSDYELDRIVSVDGENVLGEEYYEFYIDEEKLDKLVVELFYAPKK